jgi:hypothetical protein
MSFLKTLTPDELRLASASHGDTNYAVVTILNQIYEEDFRGFSYGFRQCYLPL